MKKEKRNRFAQRISKFFNTFTFCSGQSTPYIVKNCSSSNRLLISTPVMTRSNIYLSPRQIHRNHLKLPFYPTTFTSIDQKNLSHRWMPQIELADSQLCIHNDVMIDHVVDDDKRASGHLYRDRTEKKDILHCYCQRRQKEPVSSSSSSSSSTSNCQSSLTIHPCYSTSTIPSATTPTNIEMLNNSTDMIEKSSLAPPPISSRFSYIIRPSTPCIFGGEYYDDDEQMDDDEFFVTAGGIVHSCPNIYELSIDNHRKLQSCDHLMFLDHQTTLLDDDNNNNLNCYDTEFDRYSILPRFQPISSSISTDSMNSELELYKERHAIGLFRQYHDHSSPYSSSFLPTTWKSDNYLLFMPFIPHHHHSSLLNSIDHGKRSRSYDLPVGETCSSVVV